MRLALSFMVFLLLLACASNQVTTPQRTQEQRYRYQLDIAKASLAAGDFKKAKVEILKALKLKETPEAYNILGLSHMGLGELEEAKKAFLKAVSMDPSFSVAWNNLAVYYLRVGKPKKAIEAAEKALSNPMYMSPEKAYTNMAQGYFMLGDEGRALELLDKALKYNVKYAPAYEMLLKYYIEKGDMASARGVLYDAKAAGADSPGVNFYSALLLIKEGRIEDAKRILKGIIRDYPLTVWGKKAVEYLETLR